LSASDAELLRTLRAGVDEGRVRLEFDHRRLDHMDSPVAVQADSNIWIYAGILVTAAVWWRLGTRAGLAAAALSLLLYLAAGRRYVRRRVERRVREVALQDTAVWRKLWRFGGIALAADGERCAAPDGNWMEFVRCRQR
jgi:hypothetical protein